MLKKFFVIFIGFLLMVSCNFLDKQFKKEPIKTVDTIVDFKSVDAYPLFPDCEEIPSREKQQMCFQLEMSKHIYASLKEYSFNSRDSIKDTVLVKLKVNSLGETSLTNIDISDKTKKMLPEFDSIIEVSVDNLPTLQPAIKRNMPVTTEFTLPIILKN